MRTRRPQSSSDPVPSSLDRTRDKGHRSVLLHEAIESLSIRSSDIVVDATLGAAGHARAIVEHLGSEGAFIGFDLDHDATLRAEVALAACKPGVHLVEANFRDIESELSKLGIAAIDKALFDLGWSGYQLQAGRGFSFLADEPLLMTYANTPAHDALTAAVIVNTWAESSIADIIYGWGEERYSRRIAKAIVERRARKPFETSRELAETIAQAVPGSYRHGRLHPATRTFQALRIATNDELGALEQGLRSAWHLLKPKGRIAVISFHSIEDRLVKRLFLELSQEGRGERITRKPITGSEQEVMENPRARSAKLRVIKKVS